MRDIAIQTQAITGLTHDPTHRLMGNSAGNYVTTPWEVTEEILFGAIENFLEILYETTGIDLRGFNQLAGIPLDIIQAVLMGQGNWESLLSGTGVPNVAGLIQLILNPVGAIMDWAAIGLNLLGISGLDEQGFGEAAGRLRSLLGNPDLTSLFNPIKAGQGMLKTVLSPAGALTSGSYVLPHMFGSLAPSATKNILPDPGFDDPSHVAEQDIWTHNPLFGRPKPDQPLGTIQRVLDGTLQRFNGFPMGASAGQNIDLGVWLHWTNVVASGVSFALVAKAYRANGTEISNTVVNWIQAPTTNSSAWAGAPAQQPPVPAADDDDWVYLAGPYQTPAETAYVRWALETRATALSGTLHADDAEYIPAIGSGFVDASWLGNIANIPMIPGFNIDGIQGLVNIFESLQFGVVDNLYNAFGETTDSNVPVGNLFSLAQQIAQNAFGALMFSADNKIVIENKTNKPNAVGGLQSSGEQTFDLRSLPSGTTWPTVDLAAGNAMIGFVRASQVAKKGYIDLLLSVASGSATNIFVNVYSMDISTGNLTKLWVPGSANIAALVQTAPANGAAYAQVLVPGAEQFDVAASEQLCVEIVNAGSVTLKVVANTLPSTNNPNVYPRNYGATRVLASSGGNSPATISAGSLTYSGVEPYANIGIASVPDDYHLPEEFQALTSGSVLTYTIPVFARKLNSTIDIQILGAGGGGMGNYGTLTTYPGGDGGLWATKRIVYGVDVPLGTTTITYYAGLGGASAGYWNTGGNGQASYIQYTHPTLGTQTITAPGGPGGGKEGNSGGNSGKSPGTNTFQSVTRRGGAAVGMNADGNPYGGGAGGAGPYQFGGTGAPGTIWFRATQAAA